MPSRNSLCPYSHPNLNYRPDSGPDLSLEPALDSDSDPDSKWSVHWTSAASSNHASSSSSSAQSPAREATPRANAHPNSPRFRSNQLAARPTSPNSAHPSPESTSLVQHTLILPQLRRSHAASLRIRGNRHGTRRCILSNRHSLALRSRLFLGRNKRVGLELVDVLHVRRAVAALRVERLHVEMQKADFGPIMKHLMG